MDILPCKNELAPVDSNSIYECCFNIDFDKLNFESQLQVLCDIVRQSIYPNGKPNPENDIDTMTGNCYTASFVLKDYLKKLAVGTNHRCVLARKRSFDLDEITTIHVVLLVDNNGRTYQVDSSPFVGYKYGSVDDITYKGIYDEYVIIDENINYILNKFRYIICNNNYVNLDECLNLCNLLDEYPILKGYAALALKNIKSRITNQYDKNKIQSFINKIKPYNTSNGDMIKQVKQRLNLEYKNWYCELNDLISSKSNYKRQLELLGWINQENRWYDKTNIPLYNINGINYRLSSFTPRFMYDNNFICIINDMDYDNECIIKYYCDYSDKKEFIPFNNINNAYVVLLNDNIRSNALLYSNDFVESSLFFLSGMPHEMVMTKFMYPNKKLTKK